MRTWFPENVSTFGADIDGLFVIILWITGAIFVLVEVTLLVFIIRYRHRPGRKAEHVHGSLKLEAIWTAIPFAIVVYIAVVSMGPWMEIRNPNRMPPPDLEIAVTAKQFEWNVTYPGPDGRLGTADDFTKRNQVHVPVDRVILVHLEAEDVIHSFFLPELRVKQDAVPGMRIPVWFEATTPGEYVLGCAELCGLGHYRMRGSLTVLDSASFEAWQQAEAALALADN